MALPLWLRTPRLFRINRVCQSVSVEHVTVYVEAWAAIQGDVPPGKFKKVHKKCPSLPPPPSNAIANYATGAHGSVKMKVIKPSLSTQTAHYFYTDEVCLD